MTTIATKPTPEPANKNVRVVADLYLLKASRARLFVGIDWICHRPSFVAIEKSFMAHESARSETRPAIRKTSSRWKMSSR
jgi:hypothetical protein